MISDAPRARFVNRQLVNRPETYCGNACQVKVAANRVRSRAGEGLKYQLLSQTLFDGVNVAAVLCQMNSGLQRSGENELAAKRSSRPAAKTTGSVAR